MSFFDRFAKTHARLKIGKRYAGKKHNLTAQGYALFKEWDSEDNKYYYWEEWELTGFDNYDSWVEYDHYNGKVTVYEPLKAPEKFNVEQLIKGQTIAITVNNKPLVGHVTERGKGLVVKLRGKMSYQLFPDDSINYAEVTTQSGVISVEDYRQTHDTDYDYYIGQVLNRKQQKEMFGKVIAPIKVPRALLIWTIFMSILIVPSLIPRYDNVCTPRSVIKPSNSTTTLNSTTPYASTLPSSTYPNSSPQSSLSNTTPQQDCKRVRVYGGGSSGVGK